VRSVQIAIGIVNERGGVAGKYKVQPINADLQSKADAAINEVERLINQEKVEIVLDVYARQREGANLSRTTSARAPRAARAARKAGQNNTDNSRVTARRSHRGGGG
jgi:ABC-type branched-subunit amino acid transport system substrate-binding protein